MIIHVSTEVLATGLVIPLGINTIDFLERLELVLNLSLGTGLPNNTTG